MLDLTLSVSFGSQLICFGCIHLLLAAVQEARRVVFLTERSVRDNDSSHVLKNGCSASQGQNPRIPVSIALLVSAAELAPGDLCFLGDEQIGLVLVGVCVRE